MTYMDHSTSTTQIADTPLPMFGMEDDNIPERIGKFRILDLIAKSMALVYRAEQDNPSRVVALKIPRGGKLLSRESRDRFVREIGLTAGIDHSGIVPVLEAGEIDGMPYYTMPFIAGKPLGEHLLSDDLARAGRLELFLRICDVVQALHARELVHRDLKPDNIMIDEHKDVRLLDFGLARACDESGPALTMDNSLLGTLQFMAPEQAEPGGARNLTPATDVYSLGMILYLMLANDSPYDTQGPRYAVLHSIRKTIPKPPSFHDSSISSELDNIVLAALSKTPSLRPSTAGNLAAALGNALAGGSEGHQQAGCRRVPIFLAFAVLSIGVAGVLAHRHYSGSARHISEGRPTIGAAQPTPDAEVTRVHMAGPETTPPQTEHVTPARIDVTEPDGLQTATPDPAVATKELPVPVELWPLYDRAVSVLTDDFAHRRDGAVIIRAGSYVQSSVLSWQFEGEPESEEEVIAPRAVATLFLPARRECHLALRTEEGVIRKSITLTQGTVLYLEL